MPMVTVVLILAAMLAGCSSESETESATPQPPIPAVDASETLAHLERLKAVARQDALTSYGTECPGIAIPDEAFVPVEFTGGGLPELAVTFGRVRCGAALTRFSGTGGAMVQFWIGSGGPARLVLEHQMHGFSPRHDQLVTMQHGAYCPRGAGPDQCRVTYSWNEQDRRLEVIDRTLASTIKRDEPMDYDWTDLGVAAAGGTAADSVCAVGAGPALDHAILVVRDLDRAADIFRGAGFRIKSGRLHANGLLNRHIKFPDGTEIELMTVRGSAGDDMARRYTDLLNAGEGGVYVALKTPDIGTVERAATQLQLETLRSSSGPWQFLSFPAPSSAAAVFFTAGDATVMDADSIFQHQPRIIGLAEVWVEGGSELQGLLRQLGATMCGSVATSDGRSGERWALSRGRLVVVPPRGSARPRLLGVVLSTTQRRSHQIQPLPAFWIQYNYQPQH